MTSWLIIIAAFVVVLIIVFLIIWCIDLHVHFDPEEEEKITPEKVLARYQREVYETYKIAHFYWVRYNRLHKTEYDYKADDYQSLMTMFDITLDACSEKVLYRDTYAADVVQCIENGIYAIDSSRDEYRSMTGNEPVFPDVDW